MATVYVPQRFEKLHRLIADALSDRGAASADPEGSEWLVQLDAAREEIANLGKAKGGDANEKKEIESGE